MRSVHLDHERIYKLRGVPTVNDRRVLNGIFWILRSGAPWRDLPENFGPYTTCYNRFVRWRMAGIWDLMCPLSLALQARCSHFFTFGSAVSLANRSALRRL